jgi:hypothetical protein
MKLSSTCIHSSNGFISSVWGPVLWFMIHTFSFRSDLEIFHQWFKILTYVLPCGACRDNFEENLKQTKYNVNIFIDRKQTTRFMWKFHNIVNKCLKKQTPFPSYKKIQTYYTQEKLLQNPIYVHIKSIEKKKLCNISKNVSYYKKNSNDNNIKSPYIMKPWWFIIIICALNFPLSIVEQERIQAYRKWIVLSIFVLPECCDKTKEILLQCLNETNNILRYSQSQCSTRDQFVNFVLTFLHTYCIYTKGYCESLEHIVQKYEFLRATNCTKSTTTTKGTCKKGKKKYVCEIVLMLDNLLEEEDHCYTYS